MVKERVEDASIASRPSMSLSLPLLLFFPLLCFSCCSAQGNLTSDAFALLAFKNNTLGSNSSILASWNSSSISAICISWAYVTCSSSSSNQQRVSELHLKGKSLYGPIAPDTIGRLDALHTLSLRSNKLSGRLPPDFTNLSALRKLNLQRNNLSGPLPSDFSPWPLVEQLDISFNSFSGSIPASLNSLTHLKSLFLQNNSLNGTIPSLDIASLEIFNVSNNDLNGSIPDILARFNSSSFSGNGNLCGPPLQPCGNASLQASHSKSNKLSKGAIVGIACGATAAVLLLLLLLLLCILLCRKRKGGGTASREVDTRAGGVSSAGGVASEEVERESLAMSGKEGEERNKLVFIDEKKLFDLEDLLRASAEVLGKGTLGTSYKAVLEDGLIVAVKRLRDIDDTRRDEYRQRINSVGRLKHDNLLPLRAYYLDKEENLLVYDFMQNGSLSALLHGSSRGEGHEAVGWQARVRIAATSARGLAFLHAHGMVHGNLKSDNVLLKSNLEACLADYCLSPMLAFTPSAQLPIGYAAPEITDPRKMSLPADVFSFGVLLLELLTGKVPLVPPHSSSPSASRSADDAVDLPRWVQSVVREEWTAEVFDPSLFQSGQPFNEEEMVQLLQIAMPCVSPSPDQRPSMVDVVRMIDKIRRTTDDDKSSDSYPEQYPASTSENP